MFHNISNPKWFGNWSRLEDEYLDNNLDETNYEDILRNNI